MDQKRLLDDLHTGLDNEEFVLHYQPLVDLRTGYIAKVEALVRWNHPDLGLLVPNSFVPLAEQAMLISELGDLVLHRSGSDLTALRRRFGSALQICVNISPIEMVAFRRTHPRFFEDLKANTDSSIGGFVLEITESAFLEPTVEIAHEIMQLRAAGAQLAVDDFGAGHSSLLYFLEHDIDYLKIDRRFIHDLPARARSRHLCETLFNFARLLGGNAIAEGVETKGQHQALRSLGCQFGQGFFFSPPRPLAELLQLPQRLAA